MNAFFKKATAAVLCVVQAAASVTFGTAAFAAVQDYSPDTIAVGSNHTLIIKNNNTLWAAGDNSNGQLGVADVDSSTGVKIMSDIVFAEASDNTSFAIDSKGTLYGWGDNTRGQISANGSNYVTKPLKLMDNVAAVSAGAEHTVALTVDGTAYGWGSNYYGELGKDENSSRNSADVIMKDVADIAAGDGFTLLVTKNGELYVCGLNDSGQLGLKNYTDQDEPVLSMTGVSKVEAGAAHSVALKTDGTVWTTGLNDCGQLGQRNADISEYEFGKVSLDNVMYVFAGENSTGALSTTGRMYTWGDNTYGQLHNNDSENEDTPVDIGTGAVSIAFGEHHSAVLKTDGSVSTVGTGIYGELFSSVASSCVSPQKVLADVVSYSAGTDHAAAVTSTGKLYTWGNNDCGQLGLGDTTQRISPTKVSLKVSAEKVWCGDKVTYVLTSEKTVYVFGSNKELMLGMKTSSNIVKSPMVNSSLSDYSDIEIYPSDGFCLAIISGQVYGWGRNSASRLLDCSTKTVDPTVVADDITGVTKLAVGNNHVLALTSSGTVYVWGANSTGQLGLNYSVNTVSEPEVLEIYNRKEELETDSFVDIAAADNHSLAVDSNGKLWVFGSNSNGQLGTTSSRIKLPTSVKDNVAKVYAGATACGVITDEGKLLMSGKNNYGALGDGTVRDKSSFYDVTYKYAEEVSIGDGFAGCIDSYDVLYCWGSNSLGQTGIGTGGSDVKPAVVVRDAAVITMVQADSVSLNKTEITLKPGKTEKLIATVSPSGASSYVSWSSSDSNIATVSEDGTVKAVAVGKATITAKTANGKTASCAVTVEVPVTSFSVTPSKSKTITVGSTFTIKTKKVYPSNATDKTLLYSSSDEDVVVVDENGVVTAMATGKATITVTSRSNPAKTRTITVKVRPAKVVITSRKSTGAGITLKWEESEGADGYEVYRKASGSSKKAVSIADTGDLTTFTDETAVAGKKYLYTVKAYTVVDGVKIYSAASKSYKLTAK